MKLLPPAPGSSQLCLTSERFSAHSSSVVIVCLVLKGFTLPCAAQYLTAGSRRGLRRFLELFLRGAALRVCPPVAEAPGVLVSGSLNLRRTCAFCLGFFAWTLLLVFGSEAASRRKAGGFPGLSPSSLSSAALLLNLWKWLFHVFCAVFWLYVVRGKVWYRSLHCGLLLGF